MGLFVFHQVCHDSEPIRYTYVVNIYFHWKTFLLIIMICKASSILILYLHMNAFNSSGWIDSETFYRH